MFMQLLSDRRKKFALACATLAALIAAQLLILATTRSATAVTLKPVADATVKALAPTTNFGATTRLGAGASPNEIRSYLRFDLGSVDSRIERATLRLWAVRTNVNGIAVRGVADRSWGESSVTWANAPEMSQLLAHSGKQTAGQWVDIDLTDALEWHRAAGNSRTFTLGVASSPLLQGSAATVDLGYSFASRETGLFSPRLRVTTVGAPVPTTAPRPTTTAPRPTTTVPPPPSTVPPDPRRVDVPASIDPTGGRDVAAELVQFISHVPDHRTIVFPAGARYRIENVVYFGHHNDLTLEGNGALFFATTDGSGVPPSGPGLAPHWPRARAHFYVYDGTDITLRNLVIRGAHPDAGEHEGAYVAAYEAQHGVVFTGVRNALLEQCTITDPYGDFVYIATDVDGVTVRNCHMERSGRQGITVANARNVTIEHNDVSHVARTMFNLEPYVRSWTVSHVRIHDNLVGPTRGGFVNAKGAGDVSNISIVGNLLRGQPMGVANKPPDDLSPRRHDWYVADNRSENKAGSPHGVFYFVHTDRVTVVNNWVPLAAGRHPPQLGTEFVDCTGIEEHGNTFVYR